MRLLFLTPFLPDTQAAHGGGAYLGHLLAALADQAEVGLLAQVSGAEMARWQGATNGLKWARAVPFCRRPGGLRRVGHTLRMAWRWRDRPLLAAKHGDGALRAAIGDALREFRPDVALVELAQMAQFLPDLRAARTVLTDHEAICPANARTGFGGWADRRDRALWRRYVARFYPMADLLQAVTEEDAREIAALVQRPVAVRPPLITPPERPVRPAEAPPRALFLGDYSHHPNVEAAEHLARAVLPELRRELPATELWLAGAHGERIARLADVPGVRCLGFQPDLVGLFAQVRLVLAPVFSGGGFRMKGLTALAHGVPVVTNALGARGCATPAPARALGESPAQLAAAALVWLRDPAAAGVAGAAGHAWVRDHVSARAIAKAQLQRLQALLATPPSPQR